MRLVRGVRDPIGYNKLEGGVEQLKRSASVGAKVCVSGQYFVGTEADGLCGAL